MTTSVFVASPDGRVDLNSAAQTIAEALGRQESSTTVFTPLSHTAGAAVGATFADFTNDEDAARAAILERCAAIDGAVVAVGTDYTGPTAPTELALNASLAADLALPVILVVDAAQGPEFAAAYACTTTAAFAKEHATVAGVVFTNGAAPTLNGLPTASLDGNLEPLLANAAATKVTTRTPAHFNYELMSRAKSELKTIVMPESEDLRILEAASITLARGTANIVLLGERDEVIANAKAHGFDVSGAKIISMNDPQLIESYAAKFAELRAKKGVTLDQARETMKDGAYFGTMMVYMGAADGLVSGANHTTANTIRPALQFIKTKPGTKTVSGAFLMSLADRVLLFADCAVTIDPTPEQLADIAIASNETAKMFGIDPRIALLSYSTGTSGKGPEVDAVREGYELATQRDPQAKLAGPIQFDAAIDPVVGKKKMPENPVAGDATVFVFPNLNSGNIGYKVAQRTANAVAVGPLLQGLRRPVNDLSRGATVDDIVNTIIMTAIQAQGETGPLA
ncbi:phosphate acetyltransferase [Propionibacterium freudenreichii]|uniref:phosphate acetyltransferase n=1 Tax=Propionibacterium freudenreichii TaxID=1744 RepID=UPI00254DA2C4|nr:phosphate acetyltransferase [Propionibacterium freudenreichii]MDK9625320.1 phosphate acetyltransferase [Propionibacterium freudenreichii]